MIPISDSPGARRGFPLVNVLIILANVLVFILFELGQPTERALDSFIQATAVLPAEIVGGRDLPPAAPLGIVYTTLFTAMYLHGGWLHLLGNMLYLWVFGDNVEDRMGHVPYFVFYTLCGLIASVAQIAADPRSTVPSLGASGAIAGVLAGYLMLFPHARIRTLLFLGPFILMPRISAILLIGFWFVTQLFNGLASLGVQTAQTGGVAFWAHVGGFVAGIILVRLFASRDPVYARS